MIDELQVQDLALIRQAQMAPGRGLTALTGETGAGKTALLSALKLLCGERADSSMVREGADRLLVQARLFCERPATGDGSQAGENAGAAGAQAGVNEPDGLGGRAVPEGPQEAFAAFAADGVVAQRSVSVDGRSRVSLAGRMAQVGDLHDTVGATVDLCGQHEHQRLMNTANHRAMLDAWAGEAVLDAQQDFARAFAVAQDAAREVESVRAAAQLDQERVEQARFTLRRIDEVDPQEGEYEQLQADVALAENAERLRGALEGAHQALAGDSATLDSLGTAISLLDGVASLDSRFAQAAASLREAGYVVEDVVRDVRGFADGVDYDVASLESLQQRLSDLQGLVRTWGPTLDDVAQARAEAGRIIEAVENFEERFAQVQAAQREAEEELARAAERLHAARTQVAPGFEAAVGAQMERLQFDGASLQCQVDMLEREAWSAHGPDTVQFLFKPGEALSARPLVKIASGGEMSRVLLAIKVALGAADTVETLVFDEVDAGVGGSAARALADVLADLAQTHQVIVVTHLAQVAAVADVHYVASRSGGDIPETVLAQVTGQERAEEVARMLSGDVGAASLQHAHNLIEEAAAVRAAQASMHQTSIF